MDREDLPPQPHRLVWSLEHSKRKEQQLEKLFGGGSGLSRACSELWQKPRPDANNNLMTHDDAHASSGACPAALIRCPYGTARRASRVVRRKHGPHKHCWRE